MRPNWYGNCVATYGLWDVVFDGLTCRAPTLAAPIAFDDYPALRIDTSMAVFYSSFSALYAPGSHVRLRAWSFEDLDGTPYAAADGATDEPAVGAMAWTESADGVVAPFYLPAGDGSAPGVFAAPTSRLSSLPGYYAELSKQQR